MGLPPTAMQAKNIDKYFGVFTGLQIGDDTQNPIF
jgi:hypothetical protein